MALKADYGSLVMVGSTIAIWAASFIALFLYLRRIGAAFIPTTKAEEGPFVEDMEVASGIGKRVSYGKRISRQYHTDFSQLPANLRRRAETAIKVAMGMMFASLLISLAYIFFR